MALIFGSAAREARVGRIVYLGGLYPDEEVLSPDLDSRREVGEILLASGVPTTVLRAAVILGSGSASFEMLRYLVVCLANSLARAASRRIVTLPLLTPSLSSPWVGLVTPVPSSIARPLVDSLIHDVACKEHDIEQYVTDPEPGLTGFDRAVELTLKRVQDLDVSTTWASASTAGAPSDPLPGDPDWSGGSLYVDERESMVDTSPEQLWSVIEGIGGRNGWYSWRLGWWARGVLDRVFGGPGLRRGRRSPNDLSVGDPLDWWRVEEVLPGHLYWWAIKPFHGLVFGGMQRNIATAAEGSGPPQWKPSRKSS